MHTFRVHSPLRLMCKRNVQLADLQIRYDELTAQVYSTQIERESREEELAAAVRLRLDS